MPLAYGQFRPTIKTLTQIAADNRDPLEHFPLFPYNHGLPQVQGRQPLNPQL
jgi:hypothetical protein